MQRRPIESTNSMARVYCACSRCRWDLGYFLLISFLGGGSIKTEILSQRAAKSKTTNRPINLCCSPPSQAMGTWSTMLPYACRGKEWTKYPWLVKMNVAINNSQLISVIAMQLIIFTCNYLTFLNLTEIQMSSVVYFISTKHASKVL